MCSERVRTRCGMRPGLSRVRSPSCPDVSSPAPTLICGLWQSTLGKNLTVNLEGCPAQNSNPCTRTSYIWRLLMRRGRLILQL